MDGVERAQRRRKRLRGPLHDARVEAYELERINMLQDGGPPFGNLRVSEPLSDPRPIDGSEAFEAEELARHRAGDASPSPQARWFSEDDSKEHR